MHAQGGQAGHPGQGVAAVPERTVQAPAPWPEHISQQLWDSAPAPRQAAPPQEVMPRACAMPFQLRDYAQHLNRTLLPWSSFYSLPPYTLSTFLPNPPGKRCNVHTKLAPYSVSC